MPCRASAALSLGNQSNGYSEDLYKTGYEPLLGKILGLRRQLLLNRDEKLTGSDSVFVKILINESLCLMSLNKFNIGQLWPTQTGLFFPPPSLPL